MPSMLFYQRVFSLFDFSGLFQSCSSPVTHREMTEEAIKEAGRGWENWRHFYDIKSINGQWEASQPKNNQRTACTCWEKYKLFGCPCTCVSGGQPRGLRISVPGCADASPCALILIAAGGEAWVEASSGQLPGGAAWDFSDFSGVVFRFLSKIAQTQAITKAAN